MDNKKKIENISDEEDKNKQAEQFTEDLLTDDIKVSDLWVAPSVNEVLLKEEKEVTADSQVFAADDDGENKLSLAKFKDIILNKRSGNKVKIENGENLNNGEYLKGAGKTNIASREASETANSSDSDMIKELDQTEHGLEMNDSLFREAEKIEAIDLRKLFSGRNKTKKTRNSHYRLAKFLHIDQDLDIDNARAKNRLAELAEEIERKEARENLQAWSKKMINSGADLIPVNFAEDLADDIEEYLNDAELSAESLYGESPDAKNEDEDTSDKD